MADAPPAGERGGFGRGFGGRGRGRGGERGRGRGRGRRDDGEEKWVPVTKLGRLVQQVGTKRTFHSQGFPRFLAAGCLLGMGGSKPRVDPSAAECSLLVA